MKGVHLDHADLLVLEDLEVIMDGTGDVVLRGNVGRADPEVNLVVQDLKVAKGDLDQQVLLGDGDLLDPLAPEVDPVPLAKVVMELNVYQYYITV